MRCQHAPDLLQGMNHALVRQSSQRPGEDSPIE
jgi:hypothetical protein